MANQSLTDILLGGFEKGTSRQDSSKDRALRLKALDAELQKLQSYLKGEERKSEEFDINKLISSLQLLPEGELKQTALAELLTKTTGQDLQYKKPGNSLARLLLPKFLEKAFGIAGGIGPKETGTTTATTKTTPKKTESGTKKNIFDLILNKQKAVPSVNSISPILGPQEKFVHPRVSGLENIDTQMFNTNISQQEPLIKKLLQSLLNNKFDPSAGEF